MIPSFQAIVRRRCFCQEQLEENTLYWAGRQDVNGANQQLFDIAVC